MRDHSGSQPFVGVAGLSETPQRREIISTATRSCCVGGDVIVRHAWESESETGDGKWNVSKIGILQVWQKQLTGRKLLAG
jgi:hypothetical protein